MSIAHIPPAVSYISGPLQPPASTLRKEKIEKKLNVKLSKSNLVFLTRVAEDSLKTCLEIVLANISVNGYV